jgi:MFS family permease
MGDEADSNPRAQPGLLGGIGEAFADRNFRVYSVGSIASWTSFFVQLVAVSWLTWELTESTLWLALIALLDIVPGVILMPFTGVFADRYDRHRIMIWVCSLSLVQAAILAVCSWS